jgi:hypothetical protein
VRNSATKQMPIAVLGHPAGTSEVRLPGAPGALGLAVRIEMQHDPRDIGPIGAVIFGVEQAQIGDRVLFVIACQDRCTWRFIGDTLVKWRLLHGANLLGKFLRPKRRPVTASADRSQLRTTWCLSGTAPRLELQCNRITSRVSQPRSQP